MVDGVTCEEIEFRSPAYDEALAIRRRLLREPLGLVYSESDLEAERDYAHFVAKSGDEVIGYLHLKPLDGGWLQMKQVAVDERWQRQGIGRLLVEFSETWACARGKPGFVLHAREVVVDFYERLDYEVEGGQFTEVGIPHWKMRKHFEFE